MSKSKKILFLLPYPLQQAPSQRFRIEAFFPYMQQAGLQFHLQSFLSSKGWTHLYKRGSLLQKGAAVAWGFLKRIYLVLFAAWRYDFIVVHREAAPLGPPVFEWLLAKVWRKPVIFDFDDAIWIPNITEGNSLASSLKCFWKIKWICKWAVKVIAGNAYLAAYASRYNKNVVIIPTCVDTEKRYTILSDQKVLKPVIGWTGSHSTIKYLDLIYPVLKKLEAETDFEFVVICNKPPAFSLKSLRFIPWNEQTEIQDLAQINIGVMPLIADAWSEGKCGFKIIQYLALGIPAVASPAGVNKNIIEDSVNGFLCNSEADWNHALKELLRSSTMRSDMGIKGRGKIVAQYSIQVNAGVFLGLFA